jgi:hypothetical protein
VPKDCERRPLEPTTAAESGPPLYQLTCDLRTINSEFDSTNFSVIPAAGTAALAIHCADALSAQSRLLNSSFAHLTLLQVCCFYEYNPFFLGLLSVKKSVKVLVFVIFFLGFFT